MPAYDVVFFDLDGTLHLSGEPFPCLPEFINATAERYGTTFVAVTNNTSMPPDQYRQKLLKMGLRPEAFELCSPLNVLAAASADDMPRNVFPLATQDVADFLVEHGYETSSPYPAAVLATFDVEVDYAKLSAACQHLTNGAQLYSTHVDIRCPTASGFIPDCGALTHLLESVTSTETVRDFGKPSEQMAAYLRRKHLSAGERAVIVGDRLYTDVALGHAMKIDSVLVLSGEARADDPGLQSDSRPTFVHESFLAFLQTVYTPDEGAPSVKSYAAV
jgi:Predicted sugar phosphatases of the HAD superfamily